MPVWRGGKRRKWQHTPQIDAKISAGFKDGRGVEKAISSLAEELGWNDKAVRRRAKELRVYQPKAAEKAWGEDELKILQDFEAFSTTVVLKRLEAEGFIRTRSSVNSKRRDLHLEPKNPQARRKYQATEAIDEAIRQAFGKKYDRLGCRGAMYLGRMRRSRCWRSSRISRFRLSSCTSSNVSANTGRSVPYR